MQKNSTPDSTTLATSDSPKSKSPKRATLDFLRQFARCYAHEACVAAPLGNLVLN